MTSYSLKLFRTFRLSRDGVGEIALSSKKAQGLLAYLALHPGQRHTRERLATLLWSDRQEEQARHSLRQTVLSLHKAFGDDGANEPVVAAQGDELELNMARLDVDALAFHRLAAEQSVEALEQAMALYEGDLLDGWNTRSEGFDEWLSGERGRGRDLACDALGRLSEHYAAVGRSDAAIEAAERSLALDALREDGHRMLMRLHDVAGHRAAALRQYLQCANALRRELDAEPEPETTRLYENIRAGSEDSGEATPAEGGATVPSRPAPLAEASDPAENAAPASLAEAAPARRSWRMKVTLAAGMTVIGALLVWLFVIPPLQEPIEPVRPEKLAYPLPLKPSIVILPFKNLMGGGKKDEAFVDSITEDITSALATVSEMFVIAQTTALTYKNKPTPIRQVAEKLGVRYVLEGSVQRSGERVRINVRLVDAKTGSILWSEAFTVEAKDIFKLQDQITLKVTTELEAELTEGEQQRMRRIHGTENLKAWVKAGEALKHFRHLTRSDNFIARALYREAIELDPKYPGAFEGLAWTYWTETFFGWSDSPKASLKKAAKLGAKAKELDDERPLTYALLGSISLLGRRFEGAIKYGTQATVLSPNGADAAALLALTLVHTGQPEIAILKVKKAMRLSPYYPPWYLWTLGMAYGRTGRNAQAIPVLESAIKRDPGSYFPHVLLAGIYMETGDVKKARAEVKEARRLNPNLTLKIWVRALPYKDTAIIKRDLELLRRAGLPE